MRFYAALTIAFFYAAISYAQGWETVKYDQEFKSVNFGSLTYNLETYNTSPDGSHQGQIIKIEEKTNLYALIEKMVRSKEVQCYRERKNRDLTNQPELTKLRFATYESLTGCDDVIRQYVKVEVGGKSMFLIHQDEFDKIMTQYLNGKHKQVCQKFLYATVLPAY